MDKFLEAMAIFQKYGNPTYPFQCGDDVLLMCGYNPLEFSKKDVAALDKLGFHVDEEKFTDVENPLFVSYKYGGC